MTERRQTHRVRGIAVRVVVFLLLGAVVNVAVAWGLALWLPFDSEAFRQLHDYEFDALDIKLEQPWYISQYPFVLPHVDDIVSIRRESLGAVRRYRVSGMEMCRLDVTCNTNRKYVHITVQRLRTGMPMLTAEGALWQGMSGGYQPVPDDMLWSDVGELPFAYAASTDIPWVWAPSGHWLPLRMLWPGFAINTLFYATILWLFFAAPGRVRRWRRIRRGLCAKCAYPVGTSEVCTECGASVKRATSAHITAHPRKCG